MYWRIRSSSWIPSSTIRWSDRRDLRGILFFVSCSRPGREISGWTEGLRRQWYYDVHGSDVIYVYSDGRDIRETVIRLTSVRSQNVPLQEKKGRFKLYLLILIVEFEIVDIWYV